MFERLGRLATSRRDPLTAWLAAIALFLGALILRLELAALANYPFLIFVPALVLATFLGAWKPGSAVAIAGGLAGLYLAGGTGAFWMPQLNRGIGLFAYATGAFLVIALIDSLWRTAARLDAERARAEQALEQQRTMFQELQHRIANKLQFVSSLLTLEARRIQSPEDARSALIEATSRLDTISRINRRLYDPLNANREFGQVVEEICRDLLEATGARNVVCRVEVAPVEFEMDRLTSLSLIIMELLTNALKHAFAEGRPGTIALSLAPVTPGRYALEVRDNGPGIPEGLDFTQRNTLGMRIVRSLAEKIQGTMTISSEGGTVMRIEFAG